MSRSLFPGQFRAAQAQDPPPAAQDPPAAGKARSKTQRRRKAARAPPRAPRRGHEGSEGRFRSNHRFGRQLPARYCSDLGGALRELPQPGTPGCGQGQACDDVVRQADARHARRQGHRAWETRHKPPGLAAQGGRAAADASGGNNNGLSDEAIARFEQWIKAGATLDAGLDAKADIKSYAASLQEVENAIARLSAKDRQQLVEKAGRDRWKKTNPSLTPEITSSSHFVLFHKLPNDRATNLVKAMEIQLTQLKRVLGGSAAEGVEKVSLYVFNSPKDFIEFARTIENRELDASSVSTGRLSIPEPYIAAVDPLGGKKEEPVATRRGLAAGRQRRKRPPTPSTAP